MAKKSAPDPRFDPRFQRGYDGPQPGAPATPALPSPIEQGGSLRAAAPFPAARDTDSPREVVVHPTEPASGSGADRDDDALWVPPRRNPYALALLVGGLAMIGVGVWLIWTVVTASTYPNGDDRTAQALNLVQTQLTPALMISGFLGVVGWLVLGALGASTRKHE